MDTHSSSQKNKASSGNLLWRILVTVLGSIFLFCIITYLVTPFFMVHPNKDADAAAALEGFPGLSQINIPCRNELSGYLLDDPSSERLLIFFYGIDDDAASSMLYFLENADAYAGLDIVAIDWPSYGDSKGYCSADSMRAAACDVVNTFNGEGASAVSGYSCSEIIIMGYSLGTGPAIYAASVCGCSDLILISPYYSSVDLYNNVIPIFYGPLNSLAGFRMDSFAYAQDVSISPLIIASETDARVPYESTLKLSECFPSGYSLVSFTGIEHGDLPEDAQVLAAIESVTLVQQTSPTLKSSVDSW